MIQSYKGRSIDYSKTVRVYRNLNNGLWSVQQNGLVVAHAEKIMLRNVQFVVNEKGRQRVIKEKRKNVHAYAAGLVTTPREARYYLAESIVYNPSRFSSFMLCIDPILDRYVPIYSILSAVFTAESGVRVPVFWSP